jgi:hypothetical protein
MKPESDPLSRRRRAQSGQELKPLEGQTGSGWEWMVTRKRSNRG